MTLLLVSLFLWFVLLSPFGYQVPADTGAIDPALEHRVFVYGTLRHPLVRWLVMGAKGEPRPAELPGFRRQGLNIEPVADARTEGLVFTVTPAQLRRLDRYERLGLRYERVRLPLADGRPAWVYQRLPDQGG